MSRVYNVLTGAARPALPPVAAVPDDGVWENSENTENIENSEETPFIEIGGPKGPIFFSPPSASLAAAIPAIVPTPAPNPRVVPEAKADPAREFPRLVPATTAPAYLSVKFHEVARAPRKTGDGPDPSLVALHFPEHAVSGEYRVLRDEIRKQLPEPTPRVLLFAAANPEAGTTTVLLNLAVTLAHDGKTKVLVADANVHRPAAAARFALKPAPGLCEVLAGQVPLAWAAQPSALPTLQVLAAGDATDATAAALGRDLPKLLGQLRQWFDWVLVDAGVWGDLPERDSASPAADAVYLVTREADATRSEFTSLRGWVKDLGGLLRGYVATRV
jgi:Mrp family chromosome partitioning ATPase